jgi:hypothetical protein
MPVHLKIVLLNDNECVSRDFNGSAEIEKMPRITSEHCSVPIETSTFESTTDFQSTSTVEIEAESTIEIVSRLNLKPTKNIETYKCEQLITSSRIIKGDDVEHGDWPFLAALFHIERDTFFCGGNLISSKHVVTGLDNFCFYVIHQLILSDFSCSLRQNQTSKGGTSSRRLGCSSRTSQLDKECGARRSSAKR